jgi:putative ABC transport system ATP-binding protein
VIVASLTDVGRVHGTGPAATVALDSVTVEVRSGAMTLVVGASGSGKTTFLNVVGGLDRPTRGSVVVAGVDLGRATDDALAALRRDHIGFVFQAFNLLPELTAWENVALPSLVAGRSLRAGRPRALELLDQVGLRHRADHRPGELSGGEMQRVAVARALLNDPELVLADEPTGNLDRAAAATVVELLQTISDAGRALVLITHDRSLVPIADRVLEFADGRIVADSEGTAAPTPAKGNGRPVRTRPLRSLPGRG